jgi:hypothetical protein
MTRPILALALAVAALALGACQPRESAPAKPADAAPTPAGALADSADPPANPAATGAPPEPGKPGGLPDDRTPVSEAPFTPQSAQGAANVAQTYFALLGERKYADARSLWGDTGQASGQSQAEFTGAFDRYESYHANIGAPGPIEGAAGSLYVEAPVVVYGRLKSGRPINMAGKITLRRVNDVPGSTAAQRKWHIASVDLKPSPGG